MKRFAMLLACVSLVGCATTGGMTDDQKAWFVMDVGSTIADVLIAIFSH